MLPNSAKEIEVEKKFFLTSQTEHWTIITFMSRLELLFNEYCHSCGERGKDKTVLHSLSVIVQLWLSGEIYSLATKLFPALAS